MKKMIGYTAFWIAVGMLFMLFLNRFLGLIIIALLLLVGYNFFTAGK